MGENVPDAKTNSTGKTEVPQPVAKFLGSLAERTSSRLSDYPHQWLVAAEEIKREHPELFVEPRQPRNPRESRKYRKSAAKAERRSHKRDKLIQQRLAEKGFGKDFVIGAVQAALLETSVVEGCASPQEETEYLESIPVLPPSE